MSTPKIVEFENALNDLISEIFTEVDLPDLEYYFEDTTLISTIKAAMGRE